MIPRIFALQSEFRQESVGGCSRPHFRHSTADVALCHAVLQFAMGRAGSKWPFSQAGKTKSSGLRFGNREAHMSSAAQAGSVGGTGRPLPASVLVWPTTSTRFPRSTFAHRSCRTSECRKPVLRPSTLTALIGLQCPCFAPTCAATRNSRASSSASKARPALSFSSRRLASRRMRFHRP